MSSPLAPIRAVRVLLRVPATTVTIPLGGGERSVASSLTAAGRMTVLGTPG
jgi:hypothetical protein